MTAAKQEQAALLIGRGIAVCNIRPDTKRPPDAGWSERGRELHELRADCELGVMTGWASDGGRPGHALVCIDLDAPEVMALADAHLPPTGMIDGRPGKLRSHRYYLVPVDTIPPGEVSAAPAASAAAKAAGKHPGSKKRSFALATTDKVAIDLQGTGSQVVCPPSLHPSGERRAWDADGDPAVIDYRELTSALHDLAVTAGCYARGDWWLNAPKATAAPRPMTRPEDGAEHNPDGVQSTPTDRTAAEADREGPFVVNDRPYPAAERERRAAAYLRAIPADDLSRSGHGGHDTFWRHLRAAGNGFVLGRAALIRWTDEYNRRLDEQAAARPGADFERWDTDELYHKIDDALHTPPHPDYPLGQLLVSDRPIVLRNWQAVSDDPPADDSLTPGTTEIRFSDANNAGVLTVTGYRDGTVAYSDRKGLAAANSRAELAARMTAHGVPITAGQLLAAYQKYTGDPTKHTFDPADLPYAPTPAAGVPGRAVGRALADITADAVAMVGGNLYNAASVGLFTVAAGPAVRELADQTDLFAYLGGTAAGRHPIDWRDGPDMATKAEFGQHLFATLPRWDDVAVYPHVPAVAGLFYMASEPKDGDGSALDEFLGFFNPATPTDRILMRAATCTPLWGGPFGCRPAVLIRATGDDPKSGRGVGKTTFARMVAEVYGGAVEVGRSADVDTLKTRLLSPEATGKRVLVWDNLKTENLSDEGMESLLTAKRLSGRKLYSGEGSVPNAFTLFISMNGGGLSRDMSQRVIPLHIARSTPTATWVADVEKFIANNRDRLFADAAAVIRRAAAVSTAGLTLSRWAGWESGVLAGCCDPAELTAVLAEIAARQNADDTESANGELLADALRSLVRNHGADPERDVYELTPEQVKEVTARVLGLIGRAESAVLSAFARHMAELPIRRERDAAGQRYFWIATGHPDCRRLRDKAVTGCAALRAAADACTAARAGRPALRVASV